MKAVLLVGGLGTRLRPLTYRIPKPLVPVLGKPLMMHVIDSLPPEVDETIIPVSYMKETMQVYLAKNPPSRKITLVDEPRPLGTGGAVKNVEDLLEGQDVDAALPAPEEVTGAAPLISVEPDDVRVVVPAERDRELLERQPVSLAGIAVCLLDLADQTGVHRE